MRKIIAGLLLAGLSVTAYGQGQYGSRGVDEPAKGIIEGIVLESGSRRPVEYANVAVYSQSDSSLVTGGITNDKGLFKLTDVPYGRFYLTIHFIGYEKHTVNDVSIGPDRRHVDLKAVNLRVSVTQLQDVEVRGERNTIEYQLDKKVINVNQNLVSAGATAVEALENAPSIRVDLEGNVSLRGSSSFTVLINGRPSVLDGSDALQQIPASAIDNIEIITNPSAKHDPDGVSGIINVIMKKDLRQGLNGIVNASAGLNDKYETDILLNYKTGKFGFTGGFSWNRRDYHHEGFERRETRHTDRSELYERNQEGFFQRKGTQFKAGIEYALSPSQTLSLSGDFGNFAFGRFADQLTHRFTDPVSENRYDVTRNSSNREEDFYNINLDYHNRIDELGQELTGLIYYSKEDGADVSLRDEYLSNEEWEIVDPNPLRYRTIEGGVGDEFRFEVDYVKPFTKISKFEGGVQYRYDHGPEDFSYERFNSETQAFEPVDNYSNASRFLRNIYSGYLTISHELAKFQMQAGLRGEYTDRTVSDINEGMDYRIDRVDFFPTFHITRKLNETNQVQASYSRRINRPRGWFLEPFVTVVDENTVNRGNPGLEPEYVNSFELNYQKNFKTSFVSVEAYYRKTNNVFTRVSSVYDSANNVVMNTMANLNTDQSLGVELMTNADPFPWLNINGSVTFYRYKLDGQIGEQNVDRESSNYDFRLTSAVKLTPTTRLQLMGFYNSPSVTAQGERGGFYFANAGLRQDLFNNKLAATLQVRDIFGTMGHDFSTTTGNISTYSKFKREPRVATLSLSFKINNYKAQDRNRGQEGGDPGMDFGGGEF